MLSFVATKNDGSYFDIENPIAVVINCDIDVPADDVSITVPFDNNMADVCMLEVFCDGRCVFKGNTDEVVTLVKNNSAVSKITARSLAGALLDNEAEPVTYINPASQFIFDRHLKPFGIEQFDADEVPFYGALKIEKGMTHWQVFDNFCRNRYGKKPCICDSTIALFKGYGDNGLVRFGNYDKNAVGFVSVKECKKPCNLISEVRLRMEEYGKYSGRVINKNPYCKGVNRVRYVNAVADNTSVKTADRMIELGNLNSYCLLLECAGCIMGIMGKSAVVEDKLIGMRDGLRVSGLKYSRDKNKEVTTVVLRKERF